MAAPQFTGSEPLVGEVVGLRTFRVDESGLLLPLFSDLAWYDGPNTAACAPPTGESGRSDHPVAAAECECGFYAFGTTAAAARNRHMRYVQAVVSCWGHVTAGTQGIRAQHARVDALWLAPSVPAWLRKRVALTYPSARVFADRDAMLAEHPLSTLPCYEAPPVRNVVPRVLLGALGAAVLVLGALPRAALVGPLYAAWVALLVVFGVLTAGLLCSRGTTGHVAAAVVLAGVFAWLLAPVFGMAGWLLRLPLLRGCAVAAAGFLVALRPGYFPMVRTVRAKAFCGVRP